MGKSAHEPQNKVYYRCGNTRHVKLKSVTIENLLSFENSEFNFKEYNVIVGPNNSGKTNLLRILKLLASENLSIFGITQQMRLRQGKESQIKLTIETTDQEVKMLLQALLNKHIDSGEIHDSWKHLTIILNWPALGNNLIPDNVILYFQNKVAVIANFDGHTIFYCPPLDDDLEHLLNKMRSLKVEQITDIVRRNRVRLLVSNKRSTELVAGNDLPRVFWEEEENKRYVFEGFHIAQDNENPQRHVLELVDYMRFGSAQRTTITLLGLVSKIIKDNFIPVEEMQPDYQQITEQLFGLKSENEQAYTVLKETFSKVFNGAKIVVEQSGTGNKEKTTWIEEYTERFKIKDSASGYLGATYMLYKILNNTDCVIFLDEPEIHLHPSKIRQIGQELLRLTKGSHNQIIIISHSPKLVDFRLLSPDYSSVLSVVTKTNSASLVSSPRSLNVNLKPHLFEPEVFFGNATFLVEGPGDEFVIRAISDKFDGFLDKGEIVVVNCGSVTYINTYIKFLKAYSLTYYGLADKEYNEKHPEITKLDDKLETELQEIIPDIENKFTGGKIKPEIAYCVMTDLLKTKDGFKELKKTKIWESIKKAISGQNIEEKFDEIYDHEHPSGS